MMLVGEVGVCLARERSEVSHLRIFFLMVETQFATYLKVIHSDNETEFTSGLMKKFYGEQGIICRTSCIDTRST